MCAPLSMCPPLALCLREATQPAHALVENTALMKCMRKGMITRKILREFLSSLYFIYDALEREMSRHADHIVISRVYFPNLERKRQLEKDLAFYYGDSWQKQIQPSRKTIRYIMRLHAIANDRPALLAAHAYVRYMGDLSGGQGLRSIIRRALALPDEAGTAFYEFKGLTTVETRRTFKTIYRDALNTLPLDATLATELLDEANLAFKLNQAVMDELAPRIKTAIGEAQWQLIIQRETPEAFPERNPLNQQQAELAAAR